MLAQALAPGRTETKDGHAMEGLSFDDFEQGGNMKGFGGDGPDGPGKTCRRVFRTEYSWT